LLSVTEIKDASDKHGKDLRRAVGTDFAKQKKPDGCNLGVYDKTNKNNYIIRNGEEFGCSWWWLRTQGNKPSRAFLSVQIAVFAAMGITVCPLWCAYRFKN
jgi:hypothetical protein